MPSQIPAFRRTVALRMAGHRERIAVRIRNDRERQGIEPIDFARKIGVNLRTLERWEEAKTTPQLRHARALSEATGRPVTDFRPDLQNEEDAVLEQLRTIDRKLDVIITGLGLTDETDPIREATAIAAATERQHAETAPAATATKKPKATPARPS